MSQGYVPGPCQVFAGVGSAGALTFVGYSEFGVDVRMVAAYRDVISDFGGPEVPVDSQFMGEHAYIRMTLNKYNEAVLQKIAARRFGTSVTAGAIEANGLGSLMIAEAYAYQLLLYCPYNTKSFQSGTIVPGYLFSSCWLVDEFTVPLSVVLKAPQLVFHAVPLWNAVALTATLYSNTMPGTIPSVN